MSNGTGFPFDPKWRTLDWPETDEAKAIAASAVAHAGEVRVQLMSEAAVRLMARLRNAEAGTSLHGATWNTAKLVKALRAFYKDMGES